MMRGIVSSLFAPVAVIGVAHIICGVSIFESPESIKVSSLAGPDMFGGPQVIGVALIIVGTLAIISRLSRFGKETRLALVIPQQFVLGVQFAGICIAIYFGHYPDGYVPVPGDWSQSAWFILSDQAPMIAMCISHTVEIACIGFIPEFEHLKESLAKESAKLATETASRVQAERMIGIMSDTKFWQDVEWEQNE